MTTSLMYPIPADHLPTPPRLYYTPIPPSCHHHQQRPYRPPYPPSTHLPLPLPPPPALPSHQPPSGKAQPPTPPPFPLHPSVAQSGVAHLLSPHPSLKWFRAVKPGLEGLRGGEGCVKRAWWCGELTSWRRMVGWGIVRGRGRVVDPWLGGGWDGMRVFFVVVWGGEGRGVYGGMGEGWGNVWWCIGCL